MIEKLTFKNKFERTNLLIPIFFFIFSIMVVVFIQIFVNSSYSNEIFEFVPMSIFIVFVLIYLSRKCTGFKESVSIVKNTSLLKEVLFLAILIIFVESFITILLSFLVNAGYLASEFIEGNVSFSNIIIIDIISAILLAPISEEFFFRGFLFNRLNYKLSNKKFGLLISIIITALIFAICHGIEVFMVLLPFSFISIFVYLKWDNLVASMMLHAISNVFATIFGLLALYGICDVEAIFMASIFDIIFLILGAIAFYLIIKYMVSVYKEIV